MKNKKEFKYKFSVIIPIYNVEKYLEETLLSIIEQDIGFEENIQVILVNDGSTDKSENICFKYKTLYPNNIIYIKQENKGVSAARNTGMKYIEGKYTSFTDADDTWNKNAFKIVYDFFEQNYENINFVSCRIKFFETKQNQKHPLDYKFKKNEIINIKTDYKKIQLHAASSIFKSSAISDLKFDENLKYSEDSKFVTQLLFEQEQYGLVPKAIYNLRKRQDNSSATQTNIIDKTYYINTIKYFYYEIFEKSIQKYGKVLPYFQFVIMYTLKWRLIQNYNLILTKKESSEYTKLTTELLQNIEDYIIDEQNLSFIEKKFILLLKNNSKINTNLFNWLNLKSTIKILILKLNTKKP